MKQMIWRVHPAVPVVLRHCKKCGVRTEFISSGLFRVNAQKKSLDIWLIYNCRSCRASWNAAIYSRISPQSIDNRTLEAYHQNDDALAAQWAGNIPFLHSLGCDVELPEYTIEGESFSPNESVELEIRPVYPLPVRVSALIREKLGISRNEYEKLLTAGTLIAPQGQDLTRCRLNDGIRLIFKAR